MTEKYGDLIAVQSPVIEIQHADNDEQTCAQLAIVTPAGFDLGVLLQMQQVLDRQWVELVLGGEGMDHPHI